MRTQSIDTHLTAEQVQLALLRQATVAKRLSIACSLSQTTRQLSRRAIGRASPTCHDPELDFVFVAYHYGQELAICLRQYLKPTKASNMKPPEILLALKPVVAAFEQLDVPYYIGGSLASSAYGIARATMDVDLIADLKPHQVTGLVNLLLPLYYIDDDMILQALEKHSSFNLIHLDTMFKIDVFVLKDDLYQKKSFERRRTDSFPEEQGTTQFYWSTPEDLILNKLEWYRLTGGVSERQWHDVLGVLKVQHRGLDFAYLQEWATKLQLTNLWQQVFNEAGID